MQLKPETRLQNGKYKIVKTLGQGGFGITYLAEHVLLKSEVAVKEFFMKDCCERDEATGSVTVGTGNQRKLVEKFRGKFIREAQMIYAMSHPNIVRVTDVFEENGTAYYVMENLPGGSLADKVKREGPLSEELAEKYIRQVADALAYIHGLNTVHLDVKPSNVLLNAKGDAVLIDFGISKHYDDAGEQTSSTPVGISKGYAPLEQSRDGDVSQFKPSTDIYALGATLYHLITGEVPPEASIVNEDGLERPSGVSDRIWSAIEKAMAPRRKDRPQNVAAFLALLDAKPAVAAATPKAAAADSEATVIGPAAASKPQNAPKPKDTPKPKAAPKETPKPAEQKKSKTWLWALLACAAVAAIIAAIVLGGRKDKPAPDDPLPTADTTSVVSPAVDPVASANPSTPVKPETKPEPEAPGSAKIASTPSGATIWLDGKNTKKTTPEILEGLTPGKHSIKLVLDGYNDYAGSITVTSGKRSDLSQTLKAKAKENTAPVEQQTQKATPVEKPTTGSINGHEWVDLGLSVKWATCNVGASSPSDYGSYFAWGETTTKNDYSWSTLKYCTDTSGDHFSKYVPSDKPNYWSGSGSPDNKKRLDMTDDAARQNWGGSWRMPTDAEWTELRTKCTWTWTTKKNGYEVKSKNGNSIFLPAAGGRYEGSLSYAGSYGSFWSSSLYTDGPYDALYVGFDSSAVLRSSYYRYLGFSVRPVTE